MKPLRLIMRAFGPFADEEVVDFRVLSNRSFFLIHGATGAGKTTILDAICFALYGDDASLTRKGSGFRSDYADPHQPTEVTFDFELGKERFRVHRIPLHERAKRRGEGTTKVPAAATLWRRTRCDEDAQEGEVLETKPTSVTARIEELVGFKCAQFRQVVVLPQGEFRKLLLANSTEREGILERLFEVEVYQRIQTALKDESGRIEDAGKRQLERQKEILSQAGVDDLDALETRVEQTRTQRGAADVRLRICTTAEEQARENLERARADAEKLRELGEAEREHRELAEGREAALEVRIALERARRALPLVAVIETLDRRAKEAHEAGLHLSERRSLLAAAEEKQREAGEKLAVETAREQDRENLRVELAGLMAQRAKAGELETARRERSRIEEVRSAQEEAQEEAQRALKDASTALEKTRTQREALGETMPLEVARQARLDAEQRLQRWKELQALRKSATSSTAALAEIRAEATERATRLEESRALEKEQQRAWQAGQASVLAQSLEDGAPCPVCGSEEHPHPARSEERATPSDEALEETRTRVEAFEREEKQARELMLEQDKELISITARIETLERDLDLGPDSTADSFKRALEESDINLSRSEEAGRVQAELGEQIETLREKLPGLETALEEKRAARAETEALRNQLMGSFAELEASLPESLRPPGALEAAIAQTQTASEALERTLAKAREAMTACERGHAEALAATREAEESATQSEERRLQQAAELGRALESAGFGTREELRAAQRSAEEIAGFERELHSHEERRSAAEARLTRAKEAADTLDTPKLDALEEKLRAAIETSTAEREKKINLDRDLEHLVELGHRLKTQEHKLTELRSRYRALGRIAKTACGDNRLRLTFQRFVLAAFLDEVLDLASLSLRKMSKGRYHLRRADHSLDRRSAGGLDLVVFDAQTGVERPVSTLSGGESFLASLALALGLAEVVQHHTGGVRLDAIFIDEGFGTLDADALDLAIGTLLDLRKGGRMVGVISHVAELRERIDTRLEIVSGNKGSTTRFLLP